LTARITELTILQDPEALPRGSQPVQTSAMVVPAAYWSLSPALKIFSKLHDLGGSY